MGNVYGQWMCTHLGSGGQITKLLKALGTPEAVFHCPDKRWQSIEGLSEETKRVMTELRQERILREEERRLARIGGRFLWWEEEAFPKRLRELSDMPFGVFVQGSLPKEDRPCIAIVGTRSCSNYGAEMARVFAAELSRAGVGIISGLAAGIDSIAQAACLEAGGYTLGVLGSGIGVPYPKENWELYQKVKECGGILSEYPPGTVGLRHHFPMRNRLISGLADGILVVEARAKSGTLITVDRALEQGKDVYALPGRVTDGNSVGCNHLIKQGARLVTEPKEIIEELAYRYPGKMYYEEESEQLAFVPEGKPMGVCKGNMADSVTLVKNSRKSKIVLATDEKIVYSLMRLDPKHFDSLVWESNLSPQALAVALTNLESGGWIRQPTPNYYAVRME